MIFKDVPASGKNIFVSNKELFQDVEHGNEREQSTEMSSHQRISCTASCQIQTETN